MELRVIMYKKYTTFRNEGRSEGFVSLYISYVLSMMKVLDPCNDKGMRAAIHHKGERRDYEYVRYILCNMYQMQRLALIALIAVAPGFGHVVEKASWP